MTRSIRFAWLAMLLGSVAMPAAAVRGQQPEATSSRRRVPPAELSTPATPAPPAAPAAADASAVRGFGPITVAGVTPGRSTAADLKAEWGDPVSTQKKAGTLEEQYRVGSLGHVVAVVRDDQVVSIRIHLERPVPVASLRRTYSLESIRQVLPFR